MIQRIGFEHGNRILVCVDSYENKVFSGRIYGHLDDTEPFESLTEFLIKTESLLDELQRPQAYTSIRSFSNTAPRLGYSSSALSIRHGLEATFEIQVLYRQHTSWQGILYWREQHIEQRFRSVLELIFLMDSALQRQERREFA